VIGRRKKKECWSQAKPAPFFLSVHINLASSTDKLNKKKDPTNHLHHLPADLEVLDRPLQRGQRRRRRRLGGRLWGIGYRRIKKERGDIIYCTDEKEKEDGKTV
jgi:hypothetical protein